MIVYEGPSRVDRQPIVGIITGINSRSANRKTGGMAQLWILRSDIDPVTASESGADAAVCGTCPHRGPVAGSQGYDRRTCYVNLGQAPLAIYRAYKAGRYPWMPTWESFELRSLRLGAYGEPTALPFRLLRRILDNSQCDWTGYTHRWRQLSAARWGSMLMASVDTAEDALLAQQRGWRTFRVRGVTEQAAPREVICPASAEAGRRLQCESCLLCGGSQTRRAPKSNIVIAAHGPGARAISRTTGRIKPHRLVVLP